MEAISAKTSKLRSLTKEVFTGEEDLPDETSPVRDSVPSYKKFQIDLDEELSAPPVAMSITEAGKEITLFTKGNFSIITGAAKTKKTFLASMLIAEAVGRQGKFFSCPSAGVNILFDTEQAKYKVQQIGKRIAALAGTTENLQIYSLRTEEPSQRFAIIDQVLGDTSNINFVVIDGIVDLDIDPILQADQAQKIIQGLMKWSEVYGIHICCILHYNKTVQTLLGHLGSFAHRKADAIISVSKDKENENVSIVEAVDTREKPFKPFSFTINENGLPEIVGSVETEKPSGKKALLAKDIPEETHRKYLLEIFELRTEGYTYAELIDKIKLKYQEYGIVFGESKAREFLSHCENLGIVQHNGRKGRAAKYIYQPVQTTLVSHGKK